MSFYDFFQRMTGQQPPMSGQPNQPQAPFATMPQIQADDYRDAALGKMGQLGMLLVAAGQRMTPKERATILAQAPQYMDGVQRDAMTAAQARLMNMQGRAAQDELSRTEALRQKFNDPNYLKSIGLSPEQAQALGPSGIQKLLENQALANTPDNVLERQVKQAQLQKLLTPEQEKPTLVDMPDGSKGMWYPGQTNVIPVEGTGQGAKPATQDQAASAGFVTRMRNANDVMSDPKISEYGMGVKGTMNRANSAIPIIGNSFVDPQYQQLDQAQRNFINATLRRESGASISPGEFENARIQYFPQVGDSPEVIKQKELNRQDAIKGVLYATTPQFQKEFGDISRPQQQLPEGVTSIRKVR